jgi:hypothetical protein
MVEEAEEAVDVMVAVAVVAGMVVGEGIRSD